MSVSDTATLDPASLHAESVERAAEHPALVILASREEPHRVGEILRAPSRPEAKPVLIGRGPARDDDPCPRGGWLRQRPGVNTPTPPLAAAAISRAQLRVSHHADGAHVENLGRRRMRLDGQMRDGGVLPFGGCLALDEELLLMLVRRPVALPPARAWPAACAFEFGAPDPFGMVGESPAAWALRDELAFTAKRNVHALIRGPTGSGKELAARAIHALSAVDRALVARSAATIPESLVDAELFGNARDYPNPGTPAREGLVGAADGSTLFLDEIGELPEAMQARLLRVLDAGEYQRLGEDETRTARFRLLAATNRPTDRLKHDLLARFGLRVQLPPLDARAEDVPLLARHLVREAATDDVELRERFVDGDVVRIAPQLVEALARHRYAHGVRELASLLWRSIQASRGEWIAASQDVLAELEREAEPRADAAELDADAVRAALDEHDWVIARAWRALGVKNRHVLNRLMKKHGIERPQ